MMMGGENLNIISANVRGLRQQHKRVDFFEYCKSLKPDILCLQETHLTQKDHNLLIKEWNVDYILAGNSTNSRGVAVLLNKTFEYTIKQCIKDPEGRYIILELDITHLRNIFLINIYGPNSDEPAWFLNLFQKVQNISNDNEIWVGDWNVSLTDMDNYNYVKARNSKSNIIINNFIKNNIMSDIWRIQNQDRKRFTWRTERPCKRSRLDYFLISEDILALNPQSQIHNAYRSDHNIITLSIQKSTQQRGKGLWKMNNALLENLDFVKMVKKEIALITSTYALPIYSNEFVQSDHGETLELSISDTLFLETLLCQIRGQIIRFSKKLKREEKKDEIALISEIKVLQELIDSGNEEVEKLDSLRDKSLKLENLREKSSKGAMIRSRANIIDNWEKPSKFFLNLEKRNFTNKNIPSLITDDEKVITDSKKILVMQKDFYQDLYSSKDSTPILNSKYSDRIKNIPRISEEKKIELERPYIIEELETTIRSSKTNKAPGPDGFSNEFFKFFIEDLKHWIFRYLMEGKKHGKMSKLSLEGVITCIPKQGKLRNTLKNWRPLTLLNSIYKFYSSMVANRLKLILPSVINEDQTGFISGRFIGENTRMIYDTIHYCEEENKKSLLLVLDFSKAFDTIEWPFIEDVFKIFNFGEEFIEMIKLFQNNSTSRVEQNGHLSESIVLARGCRQGDPLSPYVFVLCAEILSHVIRETDGIKGIRIHDIESKASQYADDTTLMVEEDYESVCNIVRILKWFKSISGLEINNEKTKVVKIGASRGSSISWQGKFGFNWTSTFEILGIYYDITKMGEITEININRKMGEIRQLIRIWSVRNLTPYGKVCIIKSLLMSKITHMLLSLPSPNVICIKELYNTFSNFLWCGKPPKWRKEILEGEIYYGGLKLQNISIFDQTLKLSWLRRYLQSSSKWTLFPNSFELDEAFLYGPDYLDRIIEMTSNKFWIDVIRSLQMLWRSEAVKDKEVILNTPLWLNSSFEIQLKRDWLNKGINSIADFLGVMKVPLSMEEFTTKYGVKTNFLEYNKIVLRIKKFLEWMDKPLYCETLPRNSTINILVNLNKKGCSRLYSKIKDSNDHILHNIATKWYDKTNLLIDSHSLGRSFSLHHRHYNDTYLRYIQFRTLHYRFFTNDRLFKMGIKKSNLCGMCQREVDSVDHMLLFCEESQHLWTEVQEWIIELGMVHYILSNNRIIEGDLENTIAVNSIILLTKKVIYNAMKKERKPHILNVKHEVKSFYYQEKYKQYIKGHRIRFEKQYNILSNIYDK